MNLKPKLIDTNLAKKIIKDNKIDNYNIFNDIIVYTSNNIIYFIKNYYDFIIVILLLSSILYFRYKYNKTLSKNFIQVNYYKNYNYEDDNLININKDIESDVKIDDYIKDKIEDEINDIESRDLEPINLDNLSSNFYNY
jgi:hypothetical protein|tara:strand:+ start:633 stop:1049 length:417 start_codon:yes stop_codon:yes gene_type:complete